VWQKRKRKRSIENERRETYLTVENLAFTNEWELLYENTPVWVEPNFATGRASSVESFEELSHGLLVVDTLLYFTGSKMNLVGELG